MWWNHLTKPPVWQAVWPIALGFMPIGAAFGIFAQQTGFTAWEVLGFSMIIFAGSAQFIGIAMMIAGSSIFSIVLTTFIVNLRHVLFSSTLASYMSGSSKKFLALFAFGITDETFAVNLGRFAQKTWSPSQALCLNMICYVAWALSTVAGCYIGEVIKIDTAFFVDELCQHIIAVFRATSFANNIHFTVFNRNDRLNRQQAASKSYSARDTTAAF